MRLRDIRDYLVLAEMDDEEKEYKKYKFEIDIV